MTLHYNDIPQLTRWGAYAVDVPWGYVERWLEGHGADIAIELEPDFQRAHVWDDEKRRRYVEFRLRGGRSAGDLLFNCAGWNGAIKLLGPLQLVDGLQRLTAVRMFLRDELTIFAELDTRKVGYVCSEIEGNIRSVSGPVFRIHVNDLPDRASVLRWYLEINDGGVVHSTEEIARVRELLAQEIEKST